MILSRRFEAGGVGPIGTDETNFTTADEALDEDDDDDDDDE